MISRAFTKDRNRPVFEGRLFIPIRDVVVIVEPTMNAARDGGGSWSTSPKQAQRHFEPRRWSILSTAEERNDAGYGATLGRVPRRLTFGSVAAVGDVYSLNSGMTK